MAAPTNDPWFAFLEPRPRARMRLFCFPFAGGGAQAYRTWPTEMPEEIEVLPVQLPGRERRLREMPFVRMEPLIDALARVLDPYLDLPFAIFGHSMGGAIGYEVARRLVSDRGLSPVHLLVSARHAPHKTPEDKADYALPDAELVERLREMNGTPAEVLEHPELMALMLPLIRADFELNDTYRAVDRPPLECPVTAFGGLRDKEVTQRDLEAWREVTTGSFELRMFPGDHFYLHEDRDRLTRLVAQALLRRLEH
ncbi:MAG: thioesterase [bacterium]|nr:thioesterase [bacterium]